MPRIVNCGMKPRTQHKHRSVRRDGKFSLRYYWRRKLVFCSVFVLAVGLLPTNFIYRHADLPSPGKIRSGDVVFIRGKSFRSAVVRLLEGSNRSYSHVGLVVLENGLPFIIHADPEHDATTDRVIKEPWDAVISPKRITAATIFRVVGSSTADRLGIQASTVAQQFWRDELPFDHEFDLTTPQKLYCTELVWRAYMAAGIDLRGRSFGSDRKYLLPSDLIKSGLLWEVQRS